MDDSAVSSNLAFIIAMGILLGSVGSVYVETADLADVGAVRAGEQLVLQNEASSLRDLLLGTQGRLVDGANWSVADGQTDTLDELGLLDANGTQIAFDKLTNLRLAKFAADGTDDRANYEEVEHTLGFDGRNLGFHIRSKPALDSVDDILHGAAGKDGNLLVSYIGNVSKISGDGSGPAIDEGLEVSNLICGDATYDETSFRYSVDIRNGGSEATQFFVVFDVFTDWQEGDNEGSEPVVTRQGQTFEVPAGSTAEAWVEIQHGPGGPSTRVDCDGTDHVVVEVWDSSNMLRRQVMEIPDGTGNASLAPGEFFAELDDAYYGETETVTVRYGGGLVSPGNSLTMNLYSGDSFLPTTDPVLTLTDNAHSNTNKWKFTFEEGDIQLPDLPNPFGQYVVEVVHDATGMSSVQRLLIAESVADYTPQDASGASSYDEDPALRQEVEMIDSLMGKFCPFYYDDPSEPLSTNTESKNWTDRCSLFKDNLTGDQLQGDVYPDLKDELLALVSQLEYDDETPRYDYVKVLAVGSNVAHNSMTSGNFKWPLKRWVEGGGTLIVFGSPAQSTNWLNPIFGIKETSSSGGLSTPDSNHPLLSVPDALPYDTYDTRGYGWTLTSADADAFTNVVKQGETPVTVVSEPGAYGKGTIILTTWLPYDATGTGDPGPGMMMMNNFLKHGYHDLFLDYGPPIPPGTPVVPALGFAQVQHPQLEEPVSLRFTIYVFPYR